MLGVPLESGVKVLFLLSFKLLFSLKRTLLGDSLLADSLFSLSGGFPFDFLPFLTLSGSRSVAGSAPEGLVCERSLGSTRGAFPYFLPFPTLG